MHGRIELDACNVISWNTHKKPFACFGEIAKDLKRHGLSNSVGLFQEVKSWTAGARSHGFVLHKAGVGSAVQGDCGVLLPWDLERLVGAERGGAYWYRVLVPDVIFLSCHLLDHSVEGGRA